MILFLIGAYSGGILVLFFSEMLRESLTGTRPVRRIPIVIFYPVFLIGCLFFTFYIVISLFLIERKEGFDKNAGLLGFVRHHFLFYS